MTPTAPARQGKGSATDPASKSEKYGSEQPLTARGRRTRSNLIQAAREVFEEAGFSGARVDGITSKAKTSYGSFYTYFDSKEEIFREVVKQVTGEMFEASAVGDSVIGDSVARIEAANRSYLKAYARNARIMSLIEEVAPYDSYSKVLLRAIRSLFVQRNERGIRRMQEQGLADRRLDAPIAASALGGMVELFARNSFLMGEPYEEDKAVETLTRLWAGALGLPTS